MTPGIHDFILGTVTNSSKNTEPVRLTWIMCEFHEARPDFRPGPLSGMSHVISRGLSHAILVRRLLFTLDPNYSSH